MNPQTIEKSSKYLYFLLIIFKENLTYPRYRVHPSPTICEDILVFQRVLWPLCMDVWE